MDRQRNTLTVKPQSKVVLIIALLLSLLSFSDQATYQYNKHHSVKTEQINSISNFSRKSKTTTNASPYENIVVAPYSNHHRLGMLLAHSRSIKICMEHVNRKALTFPKATGFFIFSDVTHTSDEDNFNSIRG